MHISWGLKLTYFLRAPSAGQVDLFSESLFSWALANLATNSEINSRVIYEKRGLDAVIIAIRAHHADLSVQVQLKPKPTDKKSRSLPLSKL